MLRQSPSPDGLRALVRTTLRVRHAAPWISHREQDIFGVRDPQTGRLCYVSVNGHRAQVPGIGAYPELTGWMTVNRLTRGSIPEVNVDSLLVMRARVCAFHPFSRLPPGDRCLLGVAGVRFAANELAPAFTSFEPGYAPWPLEAEEARLLTVVMEQTLAVARDFAADPGILGDRPPLCAGRPHGRAAATTSEGPV